MMILRDAAAAIGGRVVRETDSVRIVSGVFSDSRAILPGGLFVALRGMRFDGHDFVRDVIAGGAAAAMVDRAWAEAQQPELPLLVVEDSLDGLGRLAAWWRSRHEIPLIGVTGSNGKTTVKEMCAAILRARFGDGAVLATGGNLNNHIGLPLTLLLLRPQHRAAVIEMGMNRPGEIEYLTQIARPSVALINNAQRAHLEGLGSIEAVARAKAEIFGGLMPGGVAVVNLDDPNAALWLELNRQRQVVTFGLDHAADIMATVHPETRGQRLKVDTGTESAEFVLPLPGRHNARNALAAIAATRAAGADLATAARALGEFAGVHGRLQRKPGMNGAMLIDDTYNANPDSMRAAIDVLSALPGTRILVMGDMGEVGATAGQAHSEIGGYARSMGIDRLLCIGEHSAMAAHNFGPGADHFARLDDLLKVLRRQLGIGTTVLVKGSRFMRMERVIDAVIDRGDGNHAA